MKKFLFLLMIIMVTGCELSYIPAKKPFIVIYKDYGKTISKYIYQDSVGNRYKFWETRDKYNIGDTLK